MWRPVAGRLRGRSWSAGGEEPAGVWLRDRAVSAGHLLTRLIRSRCSLSGPTTAPSAGRVQGLGVGTVRLPERLNRGKQMASCGPRAWEGAAARRVTAWLPCPARRDFRCRVSAVHPARCRQDGDGEQHPEGSGGRVGDRIGAAEAGRGCLRGRRGADEQCCPACPALAGPASARGPRGQCGCGQPGGDQSRGRRWMPGRHHGETAPGQVQGGRGEQQHHDQRRTTWAAAAAATFPSSPSVTVISQGRRLFIKTPRSRHASGAPCAWHPARSAAVTGPCRAVCRARGRPWPSRTGARGRR